MADLISLLFGTVKNKIGTIELDATLEETHERSAEVTGHPVEGGSYIQDNIVNTPKTVTLNAMITDDPLGNIPGGQLFSQVAGLLTGDITSSESRSQSAFTALDALFDARTLITVVSGYKVYENMAITSLTMPKTREGALRLSCTLKQITYTTAQNVKIAGLAKGNVADDKAQAPATSVGTKPTTPAAPAAQQKSSSILSRIFA